MTQETDASSDQDTDSIDEQLLNFVDNNKTSRHLLIPLTLNSDPYNPHQFLTHLVLSLGKYDTEVDALTHRSFRTALRGANLIGADDDIDSLKAYSRKLTRLYVEEQVVYFP